VPLFAAKKWRKKKELLKKFRQTPPVNAPNGRIDPLGKGEEISWIPAFTGMTD